MAPAPFRASLCPLPHPACFADITPSPLPSSLHPLHLHLDLTHKHCPLATPLYYAPLLCNPISCSLANRISLEQNINAMPSEKVRLSHVDVIRAPSRLETAPSTWPYSLRCCAELKQSIPFPWSMLTMTPSSSSPGLHSNILGHRCHD
jgi:hypothetical protein